MGSPSISATQRYCACARMRTTPKCCYSLNARRFELPEAEVELFSAVTTQLNNNLCALMGIERSVTAAYHPQTNGLDEKTNDNIKRALTKLVNDQQNNWDAFLDAALFALRSKVHTTTKHSPFMLMYGREAVFPSEVPIDMPLSTILLPEESAYCAYLEKKQASMETMKTTAAENISKTQEKQRQAYEKRVLKKKYKDIVYSAGQEVLLFNMRKRGRKGGRIEPAFFGPYLIKEISGKQVTLSNLEGIALKTKYSVDHIKPYKRSLPDEGQVSSGHKTPHDNKRRNLPDSPVLIEESHQIPERHTVLTYASSRQLKCCGLQKIKAKWRLLSDHTNYLTHLSVPYMGPNGWLMTLLTRTFSSWLKNSRNAFISLVL
ncbi:hypothetical protein ACEWY4_024546 [Coilia grayii]|uniref:Integrase catalytic domain-containing protein n=1 Tax=Coilia grayii TaxID=363190 RepID=A0ABD1J0M6_9TELE